MRKKRVISLSLSLAMLLSMAACGDKKNNNMASTETATNSDVIDSTDNEGKESVTTADSVKVGPSIRTSFCDYSEDKEYEIVNSPNVSEYKVNEDFSNVINADRFAYLIENNDEVKEKLLNNGFVVLESYEDEFYPLYEENRYAFKPNFVTTDSLLHTYHLYFAHILKGLEKDYFSSELKTVCNLMVDESKKQLDELTGTSWEDAAKRNLAYFTVAAKLLDSNATVDPAVEDLVNQELSLIEGTAGVQVSPLMNYGNNSEDPLMEDYTQYIVRGYYTESEELSAYFKTMMWFGRISFRQNNEEETKSAVLITKAMDNAETLSHWSNIYNITSFFMGNSDDPGIYDYYPIVTGVYGDKNITEIASDSDNFKVLLAKLDELKPPAINSVPVWDDPEDEDSSTIKAFRFMGQRETFDAVAFQKLIYSVVGANGEGEYRMLPSAMDIPAVLGSNEAAGILEENGAFEYEDYKTNLEKLKTHVASADSKVWNSTLYSRWINTLRPLTVEKGKGYPMFMQNSAWSKKQLNSFLGSYAELKHDSVLYAKQVYAEMGGGDDYVEGDFRGYVDPEPEVYEGIAKLAASTRDGLKNYGMISEEDAENLTILQELAEQLLTISNKELKEEPLTDEEHELIKSYGGQIEHFWYEALADENVDGYLNLSEHPAAIVTDIATDPNGAVLEVGTGKIDKIYVIVNVDGSLRIASGTVYSYYEFVQPLTERLTDKDWRIKLGIDFATDEDGMPIFDNYEEKKVEQPAWTDEFKIRY